LENSVAFQNSSVLFVEKFNGSTLLLFVFTRWCGSNVFRVYFKTAHSCERFPQRTNLCWKVIPRSWQYHPTSVIRILSIEAKWIQRSAECRKKFRWALKLSAPWDRCQFLVSKCQICITAQHRTGNKYSNKISASPQQTSYAETFITKTLHETYFPAFSTFLEEETLTCCRQP